MAQHDERPLAESRVDHAHDDGYAHDRAHDHAHLPYDMAEVERELTADRQWMFDKFIQWTAWNVVLIVIVLALLALTQT